jgi:hypothetical protein
MQPPRCTCYVCNLSNSATAAPAPEVLARQCGVVTTQSDAANWLCHACKRSERLVHASMNACHVMKQAKQVLLRSTPKQQASVGSRKLFYGSNSPV